MLLPKHTKSNRSKERKIQSYLKQRHLVLLTRKSLHDLMKKQTTHQNVDRHGSLLLRPTTTVPHPKKRGPGCPMFNYTLVRQLLDKHQILPHIQNVKPTKKPFLITHNIDLTACIIQLLNRFDFMIQSVTEVLCMYSRMSASCIQKELT